MAPRAAGSDRTCPGGSLAIFGAVLFGIVGLGLIVLGWWGSRRIDALSVMPAWDENAVERRKRTMRRGSFTCLGLGVLFVVAAVLSIVGPHPR